MSTAEEKRKHGHYWVIFPYTHGNYRWEPALWDSEQRRWILIASPCVWRDADLVKIGEPLPDPPPPPANLSFTGGRA